MKDNNENKDHSRAVLWFTLTTTAILLLMSFIPPTELYGWHLKRVNILDNIIDFNDPIVSNLTSKDIIDTTSMGDLSASTLMEMDSISKISSTSAYSKDKDSLHLKKDSNFIQRNLLKNKTLNIHSCIQDYSPEYNMLNHIIKSLLYESKNRKTRIAFLGDSFIEGDILTSRFRTLLQDQYGGQGVGFIPFADPMSKYRPIIKQEYENWTLYNILKKKSVPRHYQNDFYISGYVSIPRYNAYAKFSSKLNEESIIGKEAKIVFKNRGYGKMVVTINDKHTLTYELERKDEVQQIIVNRYNIKTLDIHLSGCNDFVGYGVFFENNKNGVYVDNYGLRSNSGITLFSTNKEVNKGINQFQNYDLIILEYGLNALQKNVTNYTYYANKLERLVDYIKTCFPNSTIMVLSIGDVGMKLNDKVITAPAVRPLVEAQRKIAQNCRVTFWNMFTAMGCENSMKMFVSNGWAAKDYMHINYKGGNAIASLLMNNINEKIELYKQE